MQRILAFHARSSLFVNSSQVPWRLPVTLVTLRIFLSIKKCSILLGMWNRIEDSMHKLVNTSRVFIWPFDLVLVRKLCRSLREIVNKTAATRLIHQCSHSTWRIPAPMIIFNGRECNNGRQPFYSISITSWSTADHHRCSCSRMCVWPIFSAYMKQETIILKGIGEATILTKRQKDKNLASRDLNIHARQCA